MVLFKVGFIKYRVLYFYMFVFIYFTLIEKQILTTYANLSRFCFLETTPVPAPNVWANENPKVDTRSWYSNQVPYDCKADALPHDDSPILFSLSIKADYFDIQCVVLLLSYLECPYLTSSYPAVWDHGFIMRRV